ncbi:MAG: DUF1648 domain-containing protein [Clostridia bacterium]|nr:DUF1648 domain-containing protein [Clostridia bacterium]
MKFIKWKSLIITCIVCLLPILLGVALWSKLPESMAIHFNIYNEPDNFASKGLVVFGIPLLMMLLQIFCCVINDINSSKHGLRKKFEYATKWIIPIMTLILQTATLGLGLGWNIDVRILASLIVGVTFLVIGNYLPKLDYIKDYDIDTQKARKINRFIGFETVIMGLFFIISIFFPPVASLVCIFLLIPYAIVSAVYGLAVGRK